MEELLDSYGLVVLFGLLAVQAAGIPGPPGKTELVAAAILAARGHFPIAGVVAASTAGVVVGGFVGYAVGRIGGRRIVEKPFVARRVGGYFEKAVSLLAMQNQGRLRIPSPAAQPAAP